MKRIFLVIPALCLALVFGCESDRRTAQGDGHQEVEGLNEVDNAETIGDVMAEDSSGGEEAFDVETERTSAGGEEIPENTQESLTYAISSSMLEVRLGQIALEKAQSQEVKDYAKMIANDHKQANERLMNMAQQKNFNLPETVNNEHEQKIEKLTDTEVSNFDQEYMSMQVDLHQKAIEKYEAMLQNVQDEEVKQWIDNTLTTLRQHLEQAQQIQEQLGSDSQSM